MNTLTTLRTVVLGILAFFIILCASNSEAQVSHVIVFGGTHGFTYSPNSANVEVGDTMVWQGDFNQFELESTSVPAGALPFGPITTGTSYSYVVQVGGLYNYKNKIYSSLGMTGSFSATFLPHGSLTNEGREFFLGLIYPTYNIVASSSIVNQFKAYALITTHYKNTIHVGYYDETGAEINPKTFDIPAKSSYQLLLDKSAMRLDTLVEIPSYKACHITSTAPISIQYLSTGANCGGSYLAMPALAVGKKYVVASYYDPAGSGALYGGMGQVRKYDNSGGCFLVIATEDGTNVNIVPTTTTSEGHTGAKTGNGATGTAHPFTIGLSKGQCYFAHSSGRDASADMSATTIEANNPVIVLAGHEDAYLGSVGTSVVEGRDFMIEQMIPYEYWDVSGYISIPFSEALPPASEGHGDTYRVYAFDPTTALVQMDVVGVGGGYTMNTTSLASPVPEQPDVFSPVDIYSKNGKKISVIQYDERSQGSKSPYPAPSMTAIVPHSRWRNVYNFSVLRPSGINGVTENQYVNVISDSLQDIMVSEDGAPEVPIGTAFNNLNTYPVVSNNFASKGARYKIGSGGFFAHSKFPFIMYTYGMSSVASGGFGGGQAYYYEYATSTGMQLNTGAPPTLAITVDTLSKCVGWNICVHDTGSNDPGIKAVMLIDDTDGIYFQRPGTRFSNAAFDSSSGDFSSGELHPKFHSKESYCFSVKIPNRLGASIAPIAIIDNLGNGTVIRLGRTAPTLSLSTSPLISVKPDSIFFPQQKVGTQICTTFVFKNTGPVGGSRLDFVSAVMKRGDKAFAIQAVTPTLPCSILPKDSLTVQVCYTSTDSLRHHDTLIVSNDCFSVPASLDAHSSTGLISAESIDFGNLEIGNQVCKNFIIKNIGSAPFVLQSSAYLTDTTIFKIDPLFLASLPLTLNAGSSLLVKACFHPKQEGFDSVTVVWKTDIDVSFLTSGKNSSTFRGNGIPIASVTTPSILRQLAVRPNPATGNSVIVSFSIGNQDKASIGIYDVLGRIVYNSDNLASESEIEIPIRGFSEGMYYVRLTSGSLVMTEKLEVRK